jgi:hypothetical protein
MGRAPRKRTSRTDLGELIGRVAVDAYGDDEQLWAFRQAFEDDVTLPADGFVIGEPSGDGMGRGTRSAVKQSEATE